MVFVDAEKTKTASVTPEIIAEKDKELRMAYDERLGESVDVGFRLCKGSSEWELKKCFRKGDYEILLVGYNGKGADFGGTATIEEFADRFHGPLVLVGPDSEDKFYVTKSQEHSGPAANPGREMEAVER